MARQGGGGGAGAGASGGGGAGGPLDALSGPKAFEPVAYFRATSEDTPGAMVTAVARLPRPALARYITIKFLNHEGLPGAQTSVSTIHAYGLHSLHPLGPFPSTVFAERVKEMVHALKHIAAVGSAGAGDGWTLDRDVQVGHS